MSHTVLFIGIAVVAVVIALVVKKLMDKGTATSSAPVASQAPTPVELPKNPNVKPD